MADNRYISLKVCGNPSSNAGFVPITMFNSPNFVIEDNVPGGFSNNAYFFSVSITNAQTVYKLYQNNVKSFGAAREGTLIFGIGIAKGFHLANGVSPMDVLLALKDRFLSNCMTLINSTTGQYEFKENVDAEDALNDVAMQYPLEMMAGIHRAMTSGAPIAYFTATEEQTRMFMNDVQYEDFHPYSEVVVAQECTSQTDCVLLSGIEIPRKKNYRIIMEGQVRGVVNNLQQPINCSSNKNVEYYENGSVSFTIEDLLRGETFNGVTLDVVNECVLIQPNKLAKAKTLSMTVSFLNKEHGEYFTNELQLLTLKVGGNVKTINSDLTFDLVGDEIGLLANPANFVISCKDTSTYRITSIKVLQNMLVVTTAPRMMTTPSIVEEKEKNVDVLFSFTDGKKFPDGRKELNIIVRPGSAQAGKGNSSAGSGQAGNTTPIFQQTVLFSQQWNNGGSVYQGRMALPKNKCYGFNNLLFTVGKDTYTTIKPLPVGTDSIVLRDQDFVNATKAKSMKIILLSCAIAVVTLAIGIVVYYNFFSKGDTTEAVKTEGDNAKDTPMKMSEKEIEAIMNDIPTRWDSEDLTVEEVQRVFKMYCDNEETFKKLDTTKFKDKQRCPVIIDYNKLLEFINDQKELDLRAKYKTFKLYNVHKNILNDIYSTETKDERIREAMKFVRHNERLKTVTIRLKLLKEKAFGETPEGDEGFEMQEEIMHPAASNPQQKEGKSQKANEQKKTQPEVKQQKKAEGGGSNQNNKQNSNPGER